MEMLCSFIKFPDQFCKEMYRNYSREFVDVDFRA